MNVATFFADQSSLDQIPGGFAVSDTGANITPALDQLDDPNVTSITISDNGPVGASVAQLTNDAQALAKLKNADGSFYQLAITDTVGDIEAALATLVTDTSHIASITAMGGTVTASVPAFVADQFTLDKIVGGFAISDTADQIGPDLDLINAFPSITSITILENAAVGAMVYQLTSDAATLAKLVNENGTSYQLAISDTASDIAAGLATLGADTNHIASIASTSGTVTVSVATFVADQATLNRIAGGFAISDTAAHITAALDQLSEASIKSVALSDNGDVGASVTQLTSDAATLAKLVNENGTAYQLAVSDTASDILAGLMTLVADKSHIASIFAQGPLTLSIADANLLNSSSSLKVTGGPVTVAGTIAAVLALTVAQASAYVSESYAVAAQDTAANIDAVTSTQIANLAARHAQSVASLNGSLAITEADAAALETGGIIVSVPSGSTAIVSDTAGNLQKLTAAQISGLPAIGFAGIASTNASVTLSAAQALALEALGWTIAVPTGDTRKVSDTALAIEGLSAGEIQGLSGIGVTSVAATVSGVTLSVQQAVAFETANLTLTAPGGMSNAIADTAGDVEGLTAQEIAGLSNLHVAQIAATGSLTLSTAQAGALVSAKIALNLPTGDGVAIVDTAGDIEGLTATQFAGLAGLGVTSITATGTSLALTTAEAVDLETGGITVSVPSNSTAIVSDTAGNLQKLTAAQISGLPAIGFAGIASTNASVTLSAAQALALEALGWTIAVPTGDTRKVSDTALAIEGLSAGEIQGLSGIGVTSVAATVSGVTLSVQQAVAFETANLTLTAPGGMSNAIADTAGDVEGLTAQEIAGLSNLHVAQIAATGSLTLSTAQAGALVSAKIALNLPTGDGVAIVDTAGDIEGLTATQFAGLAGLGVTSITATGTSLALTTAEAVDLETGGITVSVPSNSTAIVSDTAGNLQKLTAAQISGLPAIGFAGIASTNASVTLSAAQALALEALGWTIAVPTGDTRKVSDTALAIEGLSAGEIQGLSGIGVTSVAATVSGVTLSVQQAVAFETANLTLTAPGGMSNAIADTAGDVEGLTAQEIAGLSNLHVAQIAATGSLTLSTAQAGALVSAKIALNLPTGDGVAIVDTAGDIEGLTATQFAGLAGLGVTSITATGTSLALTTAEAVDLETGGITVSVPSNSTAIVSDTAGNLQKLTAVQISGLAAIGLTELFSNNANVNYSVVQTSAILASGLTVAAAGSDTVTENFANGDYSVFENGSLITQKLVNADGSYDLAHFNVSGLGYSTYEDIYSASGAHVAEAQDLNDGSGALLLYGNGLAVNSGPGQLSTTTGADTFALDPHAIEAITATGHTSEVFAYVSGFGQSSITGFAATGTGHDILQFPSTVFSNATALLNNAVQIGANVQIMDASFDTLTLNNVTKTTLAANPGDFRFT